MGGQEHHRLIAPLFHSNSKGKPMQIDPKTAIWLNIIYAIITGISAPSLEAAGIAHASQVIAIMTLIAMPLNVILHFISSSAPGPFAPPDSAAVKAATNAGKVNSPALAMILALAVAAAPSACGKIESSFSAVGAMAASVDRAVVNAVNNGGKIAAADLAILQADMPSAAKVIIQVDGYAQSLASLGVLDKAIAAASNLATKNDPKAAATAVANLHVALAGLHSLAGQSLITNAANGSVVSDPGAFATQIVQTALAVRQASRTTVTATTAVTTAPTSAAAVTATAVASVGS